MNGFVISLLAKNLIIGFPINRTIINDVNTAKPVLNVIYLKIFKKLKWKARINFDAGLIETIKWYLENKKFLSQISKKKYDKRMGLKVWLKKELY